MKGAKMCKHSVGTNVMGFKRNNRWEFWYQTWALASYDRPDNSWEK